MGSGLGIRDRVRVRVRALAQGLGLGLGLELGAGLGPCAYRAHSAAVKWSVSTARGSLEARCTLPPTMGSGTSACAMLRE